LGSAEPSVDVLSEADITRAIKLKNPHLTDVQAAQLTEQLFKLIGQRLVEGEKLAFLKSASDGTWELRVFDIGIAKKDE
jgi:hypothetical protein